MPSTHLKPVLIRPLLVLLAFFAMGCTGIEVKEDIEGPIGQLTLDVRSSHGAVLADENTETKVSIEVVAGAPGYDENKIRNISVVIDRSGSMTGDMMNDARRAVLELLNELDADDQISIIAFGTQVDVILEHARWGDVDRVEVVAAIEGLEARGTTNMTNALSTAVSTLQMHQSERAIDRVLLLSDGEPNDPTMIPQIAADARYYGVAITTMGLGPYYNEDLLAQIADVSGGNYRFIESSDSISEFFIAEMRSLNTVVTRWATLSVTLGPNVQLVQALGPQATVNGRQVHVELGEMSDGELRTVGLVLQVAAGKKGAHVEVIDAQVHWNDALAEGTPAYTASAYIGAQAGDEKDIEAALDIETLQEVERLLAYWQVDQALARIKDGFVTEGEEMMRAGAARYRRNAPAKGAGAAASPDLAYDQIVEEAAENLGDYSGTDDELLDMKRVKSVNRSSVGF